MKLVRLLPPFDDRAALEEAQAGARRLFERLFERVERQDGSFLLRDRRTGAVVGAGWIERGGRLDISF